MNTILELTKNNWGKTRNNIHSAYSFLVCYKSNELFTKFKLKYLLIKHQFLIEIKLIPINILRVILSVPKYVSE